MAEPTSTLQQAFLLRIINAGNVILFSGKFFICVVFVALWGEEPPI